jgi:hypothetical protein
MGSIFENKELAGAIFDSKGLNEKARRVAGPSSEFSVSAMSRILLWESASTPLFTGIG